MTVTADADAAPLAAADLIELAPPGVPCSACWAGDAAVVAPEGLLCAPCWNARPRWATAREQIANRRSQPVAPASPLRPPAGE
jgi:hypothetical protein